MTRHLPVLRPCDVAERWQCSEAHVRNLYRRGELRGFRAGGKLLRFKVEDVEAYECGPTSAASGSAWRATWQPLSRPFRRLTSSFENTPDTSQADLPKLKGPPHDRHSGSSGESDRGRA